MDPVSLATVTAALTVLATECMKGAAGETANEVWQYAKSLLGWESDPAAEDLAVSIASRLNSADKLACQIVDLLKSTTDSEDWSAALVRNLKSDGKMVVAVRSDSPG